MHSALCITGVLVCVFLLSIIQGLSDRLEGTIAGDAARLGGTVYFQQKGVPFPPFGSSYKEQAAAEVMQADGVDEGASTPILFLVIEPADNPRDAARVIGVGITPGVADAFRAGTAAASGSATLEGGAENAAILGAAAAEFYGARIGDTVAVREAELLVAGILETIGNATTDSASLTPLAAAPRTFGRSRMISAVIIVPEAGADRTAMEGALEEVFPIGRSRPRRRSRRSWTPHCRRRARSSG